MGYMYLKALELHGFKSFAEKTVLTFPSSGPLGKSITAIVGPNGSGKSNIADAIRWVMGEQSLKILRGKKSHEMIFSGSSGKGKMGFATISLTLDNHDHRMPVPYDEVVIARRIDQSGESIYLVNGNPVRLFDLHVLLAQAQFGHGSYSIIGQGMIDRLLNQTPAERKDFFDEACGIKEFQIKRHQAALKLDRTQTHIGEAELLLHEIAPRLKMLSRQVKKLEERQEIETRLRTQSEAYYITLWKGEEQALESLRVEFQHIEKAFQEKKDALRQFEEERDRLGEATVRGSQLREWRENYRRLTEEKNTCQYDEAMLAAKMQRDYAAAGKQETGWMIEKLRSVEETMNEAALRTEKSEAEARQAS